MVRSRLKKQARKETKRSDLSGRLITLLDPLSPASEAYRALCTSFLHAQTDAPPKTLMLTSPGLAEGKSTVCANLGVLLAQSGRHTLIVDCDLRKPVMHRIFGLGSSPGLVDVVSGERNLDEVCQEPLPDLKVLTAGATLSSPGQMLSSRRLSEFLADVRKGFDHVLLDTSPLGLVSDPLILATQADGVLLTVDARHTRKGEVRQSMRSLKAVGANVVGTVMNDVEASKGDYYRGSPYQG